MDNDPRPLITALRNSHERLASLAGVLTGEQITSPSYCQDWPIAQVMSHLGSGAEISLMTLEAALGGQSVDRDAFGPIWERWNAKSPEEQAADCLPADEAHIARLEGLSDAELGGISVDLFGRKQFQAAQDLKECLDAVDAHGPFHGGRSLPEAVFARLMSYRQSSS